MTVRSLKLDLKTSQDLSLGALSYTSSTGRKFKLEEVILHASIAISEIVTITRDSKHGANYDHVLSKRSLISEQDFIFRPTGECNFQDDDEIKVQCSNSNGLGIVYLTIKRQEILI